MILMMSSKPRLAKFCPIMDVSKSYMKGACLFAAPYITVYSELSWLSALIAFALSICFIHLCYPFVSVVLYLDCLYTHPCYRGPSWSWSFGSWICNYLCSQCLSPLTLRARIPLITRRTRYNIMWYKLVSDLRQDGGFLWLPPPIKLTSTI